MKERASMIVRTVVQFRILPPLYELNRATINVPMDDGDFASVHFLTTKSHASDLNVRGNVRLLGDAIGVLHNTIVEVTYPGYLSTEHPADPLEMPEAQAVATSLLNYVLPHYRARADATQIRKIPLVYTKRFKWIHVEESGKEWDGQELIGIIPDGEDAGLANGDPEIIQRIQSDLIEHGQLALCSILYLDAKAERFLGNTRSAMAHLYMAFESLAFSTCRTLGYNRVGKAETDAFLEPPRKRSPAIRTVVRKTSDWFGEGPLSETELIEKLVNPLFRYRNQIMHGNEVTLSFAEEQEAFHAYEGLLEWHSNVIHSLRATE